MTDNTQAQPVPSIIEEAEDSDKREEKAAELAKGVEVSINNISSKLKYLLPFYRYLQTILLFGNLAYIIFMRTHANNLINNIENIWNWEEHCKEIYYFFAGASYGVTTLGFVNYFLINDALKKLAKNSVSVRVIMKTCIEFVIASVQLGIVISVFGFKSLETCGTEDDRNKAIFVYYISFFICTGYLLSLLCYNYLRILLKYNEKCKIIYTYLLKDKYL
jgi:hypothetical protein